MTDFRPFVVLLLGLCLVHSATGDEPASSAAATPQQVQLTIDRAIGYLQSESADWLKNRKCAACHHAGIPLWALSEADRLGYTIDRNYLAETIDSLLGSRDKMLASKIFPNPADPPDTRPQGRALNMGLPFLAIAAQSLPTLTDGQRECLKLIAEEIVQKQQADGSWEYFATLRRPPINESQMTDACWIILALERATGNDSSEATRLALLRARDWLNASGPVELHQEKVLSLLLDIRSSRSQESLQPAIDAILALQRQDGGWSQTVLEMKSDAFATGQSLYVLSISGYASDHPNLQRGIDFLVATQNPDGTWPMISRSTPDGSPGSSKLMTPINCAASSWATLGLTRAMSKTHSKLSQSGP